MKIINEILTSFKEILIIFGFIDDPEDRRPKTNLNMNINAIKFIYIGTLAIGLLMYGTKTLFFRTTKIDGNEVVTFV